MKYFQLPDLGEGLVEAEIVEWFVKAGDTVCEDQLLLSVETAKAIVEVPSPCAGKIAAVFGVPGDALHVGEPLVEFVQSTDVVAGGKPKGDAIVEPADTHTKVDAGTVVGVIEEAKDVTGKEQFIVGNLSGHGSGALTTPVVRALARRLNVDINQVSGSAKDAHVTLDDVLKAAELDQRNSHSEPLKGVRKSMAKAMALSHQQVVPVTVFEDVDIAGWDDQEDITVRLVQAIAYACQQEKALNAWFDTESMSRRLHEHIDVGIAVDTAEGLFVPVLRGVGQREKPDLRAGIDRLRQAVIARNIPVKEMLSATITLSNFGTIAGRYATPVVVPPTVAILASGRCRQEVVPFEGGIAVHKVLPLSLTFDHRAVTGGEASNFMRVLCQELVNG